VGKDEGVTEKERETVREGERGDTMGGRARARARERERGRERQQSLCVFASTSSLSMGGGAGSSVFGIRSNVAA